MYSVWQADRSRGEERFQASPRPCCQLSSVSLMNKSWAGPKMSLGPLVQPSRCRLRCLNLDGAAGLVDKTVSAKKIFSSSDIPT